MVRVRPTNRPFRTENFTPVEFIPQQEATPPPVISRVRGRPIVPDDFPGNPLAIRGKTPLDEENNFQDVPTGPGQESSGNGNEFNGNRGRFSPPPSATGPSGTGGSNTRTRTRLRIVPTGNRARRPNPDNNNDPSEEPRATNLSGTRGGQAPANRIPFSSIGNDDSNDFDTTASGFPRRRLRPVNRLPQQVSREPSPPVRTLRPFTPKEVQTQPTPIPTRPPTTSEELVPTAPSVTREKSRVQDLLRQTLLSNAQTEGPSRNEESSKKTSGDDHFDPNHLLAHVQAVKAVEESDRNEEQAKNVKNGQERTTQKVLDDSEESNTIPISAIPTQVNLNQPKTNEDVGDLGLTVINLQKDARNKQNFKGFVDSDLIDDKPLPFIPTRAPAPPPPSTTTTRSTTITTRPTTTTRTTTTTRRTTTEQRTTSGWNFVFLFSLNSFRFSLMRENDTKMISALKA